MRFLSLPPAASAIRSGGPAPQASGVFLMAFRHGAASLQMLHHVAASLQTLRHGGTASNISAMVPHTIRHGGPASNKPHPAEKSTPVWLAIWRIWAGFANSQLRRAAFRSTYLYMCLSTLLPHRAAAQT